MNTPSYKIYALSENALTVQLASEISVDHIWFLYNIRSKILAMCLPGTRQILVTFHELTVFFNEEETSFEEMFVPIIEILEKTGSEPPFINIKQTKIFHIPVCYEREMALDLKRMQLMTMLSQDDIIIRHQKRTYTFFMMGFLPGFLYLGGMDTKLSCPRLDVPRKKIPAGSVGIAGEQTGIYSMESPGGWNIIGRTPLQLFNFAKSSDVHDIQIIQPLDRLKFENISADKFEILKGITIDNYQTKRNKQ